MVFPPREVNNMAHTINRPPRPYEGIGNANRPILIAHPYVKATFTTNITENEEIKKTYQKEQRQIKSTLKKYGIDLSEWKLYISQWA
jgi:hypothetical protein